MAKARIRYYITENGDVPTLKWLKSLPEKPQDKGRAMIRLLSAYGFELRRPNVDYLRDGIYELRWQHKHINYRILYFFHGRNVIILSHGITKKDIVPDKEINLALCRKREIMEINK